MKKITLIVLHGWMHNKEMWRGFSDSLKEKGVQVITYDLPGFGNEPLQGDGWGIPEYSKWVLSKIDKLVQKTPDLKIILLGHSFGGRIASYIASLDPEWLDGLILYASPSIYRPSAITKTKIKTSKLLKRFQFMPRFNNRELFLAEELGLGKIFRNIVNYDQTDMLSKINCKTLLIWGDGDLEVPLSVGKEMHTLIPNSRLDILHGYGHNIHLENPILFYGHVKKFIQSIC